MRVGIPWPRRAIPSSGGPSAPSPAAQAAPPAPRPQPRRIEDNPRSLPTPPAFLGSGRGDPGSHQPPPTRGDTSAPTDRRKPLTARGGPPSVPARNGRAARANRRQPPPPTTAPPAARGRREGAAGRLGAHPASPPRGRRGAMEGGKGPPYHLGSRPVGRAQGGARGAESGARRRPGARPARGMPGGAVPARRRRRHRGRAASPHSPARAARPAPLPSSGRWCATGDRWKNGFYVDFGLPSGLRAARRLFSSQGLPRGRVAGRSTARGRRTKAGPLPRPPASNAE